MLAHPARLGGLGLINPVATANDQWAASQLISAPLTECIVCQDHSLEDSQELQHNAKNRYRSQKRAKQEEHMEKIQIQLQNSLRCCMELSQEKGASSWLTALPIEDHDFVLHKTAFFHSDTTGRSKLTISLQLWSPILSRSCIDMQNRRLSSNVAQRD